MISFNFDFAGDAYQVPPVVFEPYGHLMAIANIQEGVGTQATGTKITLSGLEIEEGRDFADEAFRNRRVNIYLALLDEAGAVIPVPYMIFGGLGDSSVLAIAADGVTFTLNAENSMISLQQAAVALLTDADQQARYPGDKGLEYAGRMKNAQIKWGAA